MTVEWSMTFSWSRYVIVTAATSKNGTKLQVRETRLVLLLVWTLATFFSRCCKPAGYGYFEIPRSASSTAPLAVPPE